MLDWTEKYRPKTLDEVIGNDQAKNRLREWAERWNRGIPSKRAVILCGKPGVGKTSTALALANDFGWVVIEMNASDVRNAESIKRIATHGAIHETFSDSGDFLSSRKGGKKLIILDEADNLYERRSSDDTSSNLLDKGGKRAIIETIRETKQPIILIVNDLYELLRGGGEPLRDLCEIIKFDERRVRISEIVNYLRRIARSEGLNVESEVLVYIAERCKGDIRSAVRDLQMISIGSKSISKEMLEVLGYRDREQNIFDVLREIFKTRNISSISRSIQNLDEDPEDLILWIAENVPNEYLDTNDLANAYRNISTADVFLGRARRTRSFALWKYAQDLMAGGVAVAKRRFYPSQARYNFPSWLIEMKYSKEKRDIRNSILEKISRFLHCSRRKANEFFDIICVMMRKDEDFARNLKDILDFDKEEMIYMLGDEVLVDKIYKIDERKEKEMRKRRIEQKSLF